MKKIVKIKRYYYMLTLFALGIVVIPFLSSDAKGEEAAVVYDEVLKYSVELKGFSIGSVLMKTVPKGDYLQINARVDSFESIKGIYYIQGTFGAMWNYRKRSSYLAYEDVYQGFTYQRRSYAYENDLIKVKKHEKTFSEAGLPHTGDLKKNDSSEYTINDPSFQDLLGVFYQIRSQKVKPQVGDILNLKVLPSGVKKVLMVKVLEKLEFNVPALGGVRRVYHVRTGLAGEKDLKGGGDIFFVTDSPIDMYITDDELSVPVLMWTSVPILGRADIVLTNYADLRSKR